MFEQTFVCCAAEAHWPWQLSPPWREGSTPNTRLWRLLIARCLLLYLLIVFQTLVVQIGNGADTFNATTIS